MLGMAFEQCSVLLRTPEVGTWPSDFHLTPGAVPILFGLLLAPTAAARAAAARIIADARMSRECAAALCEAGFLPPLLGMLSTGAEAEATLHSLRCLTCIAMHMPSAMCEVDGACAALMQVLRPRSSSSAVKTLVACIMRDLALHDSDSVVEAGAAPALARLLCSSHEVSIACAARALLILSRKHSREVLTAISALRLPELRRRRQLVPAAIRAIADVSETAWVSAGRASGSGTGASVEC